MMKFYFKSLIMMSLAALFSCRTSQPLQTVSDLDINRYAGMWYEIARLPNSFEKGLDCVTAEYSLLPGDKIMVINKGRKFTKDGSFDQITGKAWVPDKKYPGRLKVSFFWPFAGDYWVFYLSDDYRYALVGTQSRKYFWLLSRTTAVESTQYEFLISLAAENGFNVAAIEKINQQCIINR